jgi:TetR/AcrR family transcriptional repressor of mexJK operon
VERHDPEDAKVRQIRRAAETLFLRHGFGGVSTAALAREAGVSKETLYSRYPSKEAVLADVLAHLIPAGVPETETAAPPATWDDLDRALRSLAYELHRALSRREYIELARVVIAETPRLPEVGETFRRAVPEHGLRITAELLAAGRKAGLVGEVDEMTAARMFVGPLVVHALMAVLLSAPGGRESVPMDLDAHVGLFLRAVAKDGS